MNLYNLIKTVYHKQSTMSFNLKIFNRSCKIVAKNEDKSLFEKSLYKKLKSCQLLKIVLLLSVHACF